jgi:hypothetical protein
MSGPFRVLTSSVVVVCLAVLVVNGQAPKPGPAQKSLEVPLQERVAALEKEVESLKAELAALRAQIQPSGSTRTPVASGSGSRPDGARPSQADILSCVVDAYFESEAIPRGSSFGDFRQLEFGTTFTSQGGMIELARGAPKGTSIFPTRMQLSSRAVDFWVFKDSFGTLKCSRVK